MINYYETKCMKKYTKDRKFQMGGIDSHQIVFPKHVLCCSGTGGGKSNWLLNYLNLSSDGTGTFGHVTIVCKTMEPLYEMLQEQGKDGVTIHTSLHKLPPLKEFKEHLECQQLIVFDDCVAEKDQSKIEEYFLRARKHGAGIQLVYLSQSYFKTPIFIRNNVTYAIFLQLSSDADLGRILTNYNVGIDKPVFKKIFKNAVSQKLCSFKIDISNSDLNKKFSRNWTDFYEIVDREGEPLDETQIQIYRNSGIVKK